jgi:hypothetical protein
VTFPDDDGDLSMDLVPGGNLDCAAVNGLNGSDTMRYEEKRMMNTSKTKTMINGVSSEQVCDRGKECEFAGLNSPLLSFQATTKAAEHKKLQAGDLEIEEKKRLEASRNRLEIGDVKTEEANSVIMVSKSRPPSDDFFSHFGERRENELPVFQETWK